MAIRQRRAKRAAACSSYMNGRISLPLLSVAWFVPESGIFATEDYAQCREGIPGPGLRACLLTGTCVTAPPGTPFTPISYIMRSEGIGHHGQGCIVYDAYVHQSSVHLFQPVLKTTPCPTAPAPPCALREFRGRIQQPGAVDHHRGHGGVEPDPPQIRQGHPGGVRFPPHLGGRPRHPQPALCGRVL